MIESGHAQFTGPYRTFKSSPSLPRITAYSFLSFYGAVINYQKWINYQKKKAARVCALDGSKIFSFLISDLRFLSRCPSLVAL